MAAFVLAIDQGTTGSTVALMDARGKVRASVNYEFPQVFPKPGWVEHRPDEIWSSVGKGIRAILRRKLCKPGDIAAIGITNQRETALLIKRKSGLVLDPYFSASKYRWLLKNSKGVARLLRAGHVAAGTVDSFLIWQLTGGDTHVTDISNASRTSLMNIPNCWNCSRYQPISCRGSGPAAACWDTPGVFPGCPMVSPSVVLRAISRPRCLARPVFLPGMPSAPLVPGHSS